MRYKLGATSAIAAAALLAVPAYAADTVNPFGGTLGNDYGLKTIRAVPGDSVTFSGDFSAHPLKSARSDYTYEKAGGGEGVFTQPYTKPGIYRYYCSIHGSRTGNNQVSGMSGQVIVGDPATLAKPVVTTQSKRAIFKKSKAKLKIGTDKIGNAKVKVRKLKKNKPTGSSLAKGTVDVLTPGAANVSLKLTNAGRRLLKSGDYRKVAVTITFSDLDGNIGTKTTRIQAKR